MILIQFHDRDSPTVGALFYFSRIVDSLVASFHLIGYQVYYLPIGVSAIDPIAVLCGTSVGGYSAPRLLPARWSWGLFIPVSRLDSSQYLEPDLNPTECELTDVIYNLLPLPLSPSKLPQDFAFA